METYSIRNLSFSYPEQERVVLNSINLDIKKGEFVVLLGPSGCGKTTLLRQLKPVLAPNGIKKGEVLFEGDKLSEIDDRKQAEKIGYVMQNPDNQIVTDKVWHELAFGLESLGYKSSKIRLRVSEMASFFGIQNWFYKDVSELSGGQKQLLNLAAIMSMQPSVLILDEPTSQLDPIAASDFLSTLAKINRELGTTIILTEHRLEEALALADRAIFMSNGKIIANDEPRKVGKKIKDLEDSMFLAMPVPMRIAASTESQSYMPITVREGREWLDRNFPDVTDSVDEDVDFNKDEIKSGKLRLINKNIDDLFAVELDNVWFKYDKELPDIVKGVSLKVRKGEIYSILGGNGTGKSTTMSLISGVNKPYRGKVYLYGKDIKSIIPSERYNKLLGVLPQNPQTLFVKNRLVDDLYEILKYESISQAEKDLKVSKVAHICRLDNLLDQHPYDLSGGEQQRAALAKILLLEPKILLLDEPTKGLDAEFKQEFAALLKVLKDEGKTIIMISHDIEFSAKYSDRCALFFDGSITTEAEAREFFAGNSFYTTSANRMARHKLKSAVIAEDVIEKIGGKVPSEPKLELDRNFLKKEYEVEQKDKVKNRISYRNIISIVSLITSIIIFIKSYPIFSEFIWQGYNDNFIGDSISISQQWKLVGIFLVFLISLSIFIISTFRFSKKPEKSLIQVPVENRRLSNRTIFSSVLIILLIPFTIYFGIFYLGDRKYYFISLLIILQVMIPFILVFESRKPQARELVIIAVLCALGVAGRAAFFMLPQFKPIAAIVIISAVAFGAESGFLVGAFTMFLSNMLAGQGPWTPWQMFSMGIIGFLAGILFRKGLLRRDRISLSIYGGLSVLFIYGGIMNPASVIMFQSNITKSMILASYVTGLPMDLIHAGSTVFFLLIMGEAMLEKLDRIKTKYGLVEKKNKG